jgi:hypothetical protein
MREKNEREYAFVVQGANQNIRQGTISIIGTVSDRHKFE